MILGIREIRKKQKVLVVSNISDVSTLHCSLYEHGNASGTPERDVGHFVHMLHRTGEQVGMNSDEINKCAEIFMKTYCQERNMPLKVNPPTVGCLFCSIVCRQRGR